MLSDDEIRVRYGPDVAISRSCGFALVHLDSPPDDVVAERTSEFDPAVYFETDCPLCEIQRHQRICLFDDCPDETEEILVE